MKIALTGLSLAISLFITGCATVKPDRPHTEAYKGEYYDVVTQENAINMSSDDFDYEYPGKLVQKTPEGEITNALAEETYQYAMTLKADNPQGMIERLYQAAEQGSGNAHYELARELTSGLNMEKNPDAAIGHLKDAVALNHAEGLRVLGLMNIRGDNMEVNIPSGMAMLERAANHSSRAARELGYLYKGKAYPQIKDTDQAILYLTKGYALGDVESAFLLGETYFETGDYIHAVESLGFAAGKGHEKAARLLAEIQ